MRMKLFILHFYGVKLLCENKQFVKIRKHQISIQCDSKGVKRRIYLISDRFNMGVS